MMKTPNCSFCKANSRRSFLANKNAHFSTTNVSNISRRILSVMGVISYRSGRSSLMNNIGDLRLPTILSRSLNASADAVLGVGISNLSAMAYSLASSMRPFSGRYLAGTTGYSGVNIATSMRSMILGSSSRSSATPCIPSYKMYPVCNQVAHLNIYSYLEGPVAQCFEEP